MMPGFMLMCITLNKRLLKKVLKSVIYNTPNSNYNKITMTKVDGDRQFWGTF